MHGVLDGALGLVGVRAVGKLAERQVRTELGEMAAELRRHDAPELELAEARGVDDIAARLEPDQFGGRRRVLALECPVGDRADAQVQAGLDRRSAASSCRPPTGPRTPSSPARRAREADRPLAVGGRGHEGLVTELGVEADHPLVERRVDQVGLVQDDHRPNAADLGRDQVAVDQGEFQARLLERRDDQDLIDVRDEYVLVSAVTAGDRAVPAARPSRSSPLRCRRPGPEPDPVADGDDVPGVDRHGLQEPADVARVRLAVVSSSTTEVSPWMRTTRPGKHVSRSTERNEAASCGPPTWSRRPENRSRRP